MEMGWWYYNESRCFSFGGELVDGRYKCICRASEGGGEEYQARKQVF